MSVLLLRFLNDRFEHKVSMPLRACDRELLIL